MMNGLERAFTLIELMLVMALIGLMGTISVGGYRAMRRGMEERGTMQNVNQFVRNAYQRAQIDRQPTAIYCWNETRRTESEAEDGETSLLVVGRAVAVRRAGRVSYVNTAKNCLVDEFADLRFYAGTDADGKMTEEAAWAEANGARNDKNANKSFIYKMKDRDINRFLVSPSTVPVDLPKMVPMITDPKWAEENDDATFEAFGYYLPGGVGDWKVGDAYGFEFADITLPNNYIFGGKSDISEDKSNPVKELGKVFYFGPNGIRDGQPIVLSSIRPGDDGAPDAIRIGSISTPSD